MNILTQSRGFHNMKNELTSLLERAFHNMKRELIPLFTMIGFVIIFIGVLLTIHIDSQKFPELESFPIEEAEKIEHLERPVEVVEVKEPTPTDEELIARVVMAEAQGEEMIGKVAVATTILNRCDYYGLTVETVVFAEIDGVKQYSISDTYDEKCMRAVEIAKENRDLFPDTMMWFRRDYYHDFGNGNPQDYMPIGNHYFSTLSKGDSK